MTVTSTVEHDQPAGTDVPPRAAVYCRISLDQTGEAAGVDRQEQACRELAEREGWQVSRVLVDNDLSAFSGKRRPAYEQLLDLTRRGEVDAVVAYHPDRLYRRLADLVGLTDVVGKSGIELRTVAAGHVDLSTASGRFQAQILGAAAEHESARIGERVSMKHQANAKVGRAHGGGRSFGYDRTAPGVLEIVPAEAELIREAAERILAGASLNSIVIDWNQRGIPTAGRAARWRPNSLSKVLRSGRIAGLREAGGEIIGDGEWEAILDRATWERVRSRITHAPRGRRPRRALLAGFVYCAECGARMRSLSGGNPDNPHPMAKYRSPSYACDKAVRHGCGSNTAKAEPVDDYVVAHVLEALKVVDLAAARSRRRGDESGELVAEIAADEALLDEYAAEAGRNRMSPREYRALVEPIRERLADNRRRLDAVAAADPSPGVDLDTVTPETWETLDLDQRRAILRLYVDRVEIRKGKPGRTFDTSRVRIPPPDVD